MYVVLYVVVKVLYLTLCGVRGYVLLRVLIVRALHVRDYVCRYSCSAFVAELLLSCDSMLLPTVKRSYACELRVL